MSTIRINQIKLIIVTMMLGGGLLLGNNNIYAAASREEYNDYEVTEVMIDGIELTDSRAKISFENQHTITIVGLTDSNRNLVSTSTLNGNKVSLFIKKHNSNILDNNPDYIKDFDITSEGNLRVTFKLRDIFSDSIRYDWNGDFSLWEWIDDLVILNTKGQRNQTEVDIEIKLLDQDNNEAIGDYGQIISFRNLNFAQFNSEIATEDLLYVRATACCTSDKQCKRAFGLGATCGGSSSLADGRGNPSCELLTKCIFEADPGFEVYGQSANIQEALKFPGGQCALKRWSEDNYLVDGDAYYGNAVVCTDASLCAISGANPRGTCEKSCSSYLSFSSSGKYSSINECLSDPNRYVGSGSSTSINIETQVQRIPGCEDISFNKSTAILIHEEIFQGPLSDSQLEASCGATKCKVEGNTNNSLLEQVNTIRTLFGNPKISNVPGSVGQRVIVCFEPETIKQCSGDTTRCLIKADYDSDTNSAEVTVNTLCLAKSSDSNNFRLEGLNFSTEVSQPFSVSSTENSNKFVHTFTGLKMSDNKPPSFRVVEGGSSVVCQSDTFPEWLSEEGLDDDEIEENPGENPDNGSNGNLITIGSNDYGVRNCPGAVTKDSKGEDLPNNGVAFDPDSGALYEEFENCYNCLLFGGTWTALGCIVATPQALFASIIRIAMGVMGGIALLRLIYLGFIYQSGDEGKIKEAQKGVVATLGALLLILFSVLILQIVGVNILDIVPPGFFG